MKSLQTFRTLRSSRDLFKNDVLGSYFKNRVPYPALISQKTEIYGFPTTRKILENQWILPVLGKICARYGQDPFKSCVVGQNTESLFGNSPSDMKLARTR